MTEISLIDGKIKLEIEDYEFYPYNSCKMIVGGTIIEIEPEQAYMLAQYLMNFKISVLEREIEYNEKHLKWLQRYAF